MSRAIVSRARAPLVGCLQLPGDKSLSHRRALLSLLMADEVRLSNYGTGADCQTTLHCLERLGKAIVRNGKDVLISGPAGCRSAELDCGNSGTTARLLMGILAGQTGEWILKGDASLSRRPMERVAVPLRLMGAQIELFDGHLPARIIGRPLTGIDYESPVASAQVKSAVLLAGLYASGITRYREAIETRDHTERLLSLDEPRDGWIELHPSRAELNAARLSGTIAGDPSSAAFWGASAALVPDSKVGIDGLLLNRYRTAYFGCLQQAGMAVHVRHGRPQGREPTGEVEFLYSPLRGWQIEAADSASVIDEIPVLAVVASQAAGGSEFQALEELRHKESDRLSLVHENLRRMGASVKFRGDTLTIEGPRELHSTDVRTDGDHRIAMAFAVAGLAAEGETVIEDAECVAVSYPGFWDDLAALAPGSVRLA